MCNSAHRPRCSTLQCKCAVRHAPSILNVCKSIPYMHRKCGAGWSNGACKYRPLFKKIFLNLRIYAPFHISSNSRHIHYRRCYMCLCVHLFLCMHKVHCMYIFRRTQKVCRTYTIVYITHNLKNSRRGMYNHDNALYTVSMCPVYRGKHTPV